MHVSRSSYFYSGDLNTRLARYLNGLLFKWWSEKQTIEVHYSNGDLNCKQLVCCSLVCPYIQTLDMYKRQYSDDSLFKSAVFCTVGSKLWPLKIRKHSKSMGLEKVGIWMVHFLMFGPIAPEQSNIRMVGTILGICGTNHLNAGPFKIHPTFDHLNTRHIPYLEYSEYWALDIIKWENFNLTH